MSALGKHDRAGELVPVNALNPVDENDLSIAPYDPNRNGYAYSTYVVATKNGRYVLDLNLRRIDFVEFFKYYPAQFDNEIVNAEDGLFTFLVVKKKNDHQFVFNRCFTSLEILSRHANLWSKFQYRKQESGWLLYTSGEMQKTTNKDGSQSLIMNHASGTFMANKNKVKDLSDFDRDLTERVIKSIYKEAEVELKLTFNENFETLFKKEGEEPDIVENKDIESFVRCGGTFTLWPSVNAHDDYEGFQMMKIMWTNMHDQYAEYYEPRLNRLSYVKDKKPYKFMLLPEEPPGPIYEVKDLHTFHAMRERLIQCMHCGKYI